MDEVIEAMARAIDARLSYHIERDTLACDLTKRELLDLATAAYNALRETLVPVMYAVEEEGHPIISYITREKPTEQATSVTPLYALPEIDNG